MSSTTIVWYGENQIEMSSFIGHEDFWHKNGVLLIKQDDSEIVLKKGDTLVCSGQLQPDTFLKEFSYSTGD